MTYVIYGALGAILVLFLFATGIYVGYKLHTRFEKGGQNKPETPAEAERRRLIEDQNAFRVLMNYNAEMAYGRVSAQDLIGKDGEN